MYETMIVDFILIFLLCSLRYYKIGDSWTHILLYLTPVFVIVVDSTLFLAN